MAQLSTIAEQVITILLDKHHEQLKDLKQVHIVPYKDRLAFIDKETLRIYYITDAIEIRKIIEQIREDK